MHCRWRWGGGRDKWTGGYGDEETSSVILPPFWKGINQWEQFSFRVYPFLGI